MPVGGRLAGKAGYSDGGYQGQGNLLDSLVPSSATSPTHKFQFST